MTQVCSDGRNEAETIVLVKLFIVSKHWKKHKGKWKEKTTQICTYDDILYKLIANVFMKVLLYLIYE